MVTASHNPKQYNGVKIINPKVEQVYYGAGLEALEQIVAAASHPTQKRGRVVVDSVIQDYEAHLAARFSHSYLRAKSVVIDCSNGVGGIPLTILERLGLRYHLINHVPDGTFPNHGPDTLRPENLAQLRKAVLAERADLGVVFDGDADRVTFVDERGDIVPLDLLFLVLAREALSRRQGTVFYDLRFSRTVKEEIEKLGGKAVMMRVGNPFYKAALHAAADGLLGAELSGHIMYSDHFGMTIRCTRRSSCSRCWPAPEKACPKAGGLSRAMPRAARSESRRLNPCG